MTADRGFDRLSRRAPITAMSEKRVPPLRPDLALIASLIPVGARVLDLGCGPGNLLRHLMRDRGCSVTGVEIDPGSVMKAMTRGVPVVELDIDRDLTLLSDSAYDVVVLSRTLQAIREPGPVLRHVGRIAPRAIVTMPNFAYWRNRLRLLAGRAPVSKDLPYAWHESPNVHFGSILDIEELLAELGLTVVRRIPLSTEETPSRWPGVTRNWSAGAVLFDVVRSAT